jgi:SEC-C motif
MDEETMDAISPSPLPSETTSPAQSGTDPSAVSEPHALDIRALVERMIEAGQMPEPELIEQIAAAGDQAVEPLLSILRSKPHSWPEEAPLSHAIGLLQVIRHPAAIPELIEIVKSYPDESGEEAADALASYGEGIFDTLLELAADPALRGYRRSHAITAARRAAGANPTLRARLAEVIRPMLHDAIERAQQPLSDKPSVYDPSDDDYGWNIYHEISLLVIDLAGIADPLARDLIQTVFDKNLNDPYSTDPKSVEESYQSGGDLVWTPPDWLDYYRETYRENLAIMSPINDLAAKLREQPVAHPQQPVGRTELPPPKPLPPITIRNKEQPVGRNEPCWCGSGKKYKKCHLGKDTTA